jgi:putative Ca2+/H+ antiporter (TMEM165/GDT1 family)
MRREIVFVLCGFARSLVGQTLLGVLLGSSVGAMVPALMIHWL